MIVAAVVPLGETLLERLYELRDIVYTDNADRCDTYVHHATNILFEWLNRKSHRKAYTWEQFNRALAWAG